MLDRINVQRRLDDRRAGEICAIIANATPHFKRRTGKDFTAADFFPSLAAPVKPPTARAQAAYADFLNAWAKAKAEAEKNTRA